MPNYTSNVRNENDGHDVKEINASNHLSTEKSPYLLQHKDNPVHWYPWGDLAFDKAERENKPIFLSIGYSTCHWCHVMAHESFEDDEVARLLNDDFVAVKVDREERPDIDQVYMTVCQLVTGGGGWPLSIIMTPEKKPFFADTYIPKTDRYGKAGMLRLLPHISNLWKNNREQANAAAAEIARAVQGSAMRTNKSGIVAGNTESLDESVLHASFESFAQRFDEEHGGFGDAPKFPSPHNLLFLLQYAQRTENKDAQKMVERTLQKMRMGGIYDHIGFGFHRYATDRNWLVPHFEKMLYDQAMLLMTYTTAFQITGKPEYRKTAEEIIEYVLRDMTDKDGGFYSAEDADSEGEEGKFYVWTVDEIDSILGRNESEIGDADAALFHEFYPLSPEGNFRDESTGKMTGSNIIHLEKPLVERVSEVATEQGLDENEILMQLESMRKTLFEAREKRIRPHLDDKVLTDWNGLMIAALAQAGQVFNDAKFISAAQEAAVFILSRMHDADGRLLHRYRDGDAAILANLDDHAFMIWGLLELYGSTFEVQYLKEAISIADQMVAHFHDRNDDADESSPTSGKGGFFFTPDDGEELLTRSKEAYDGAIPSGNAVAITVLLRLARLTGRTDFEDIASAALRRFSHEISRLPTAHTQSLIALDFALGPSHEIVVVGDPASDAARSMLDSLRSVSSRNSVVLFKNSSEGSNDLDEIAPFTAAMDMIDGKCTAYVCSGFACTLPTTDPKKMQELLGAD